MELLDGEKDMRFMECVRRIDKGLEYFVGKSEEAMLKATEGGKKYANLSYESYRFVEREAVPDKKLTRRFPAAMEALSKGAECDWLGIAM